MNEADERFTKIVREMSAELKDARVQIAVLQDRLRVTNFPIEHATTCGGCGDFKHAPWKSEKTGCYLCVSCAVLEERQAPTEELRMCVSALRDMLSAVVAGKKVNAARLLNETGELAEKYQCYRKKK